jgi:hypothetical protein
MADSTGMWFDSQGNRYPLTYQIVGDTLDVRWTMANGRRARSRYLKTAAGLEERSVLQAADGSERVFLEYAYVRDR